MSIRLVLVASAVVAVAGCGKKSSSTPSGTQTVSAPFLAAADIAPGSGQNSPSQSDVVTALQSDGSVYDTQPDAVPANPCAALLDELVLVATSSTVTVGAVLDATTCTNQATPSGSTTKITAASVKVYFNLTCVGGDVSSLNGKTLTAVKGNKLFTQCTSGTDIENVAETVSGTGSAPDATGATQSFSIAVSDTSFQGKADMSPCPVTVSAGTVHYDDACIRVSRNDVTTTSVGAPTTTEDFEKLTSTGLTAASGSGAVWFSGGQFGVTYDQWTGTLTYSSTTAAPSYKLTPAGGTVQTGTLVATPGLALTMPGLRKQVSSLIRGL